MRGPSKGRDRGRVREVSGGWLSGCGRLCGKREIEEDKRIEVKGGIRRLVG